MPIIVISKKHLLLALGLLALLGVGLVLFFTLGPGFPEKKAAPAMAVVEEYELNVLPLKARSLPVYGVKREDKKIALTIDADQLRVP